MPREVSILSAGQVTFLPVFLSVHSPPSCPSNKQKVEKFRRSLREIKDISKFKSLDKSLVHEMDKVFSGDIPKLMEKAARPGNR